MKETHETCPTEPSQPSVTSDAAVTSPSEAAGGQDNIQQPAATAEERVVALEAEITQLQDQYLRACAQAENLRRRCAEDVSNAHKFAINKFVAELLPVKDSLEMALADQSGQFDTLKIGVDLTLKQLVTAFEKAHISEIYPLGDMLDPHKHQAISTEESDAEPNTILRVMQKGYLIAERVLRPAMVVVAKPQV